MSDSGSIYCITEHEGFDSASIPTYCKQHRFLIDSTMGQEILKACLKMSKENSTIIASAFAYTYNYIYFFQIPVFLQAIPFYVILTAYWLVLGMARSAS